MNEEIKKYKSWEEEFDAIFMRDDGLLGISKYDEVELKLFIQSVYLLGAKDAIEAVKEQIRGKKFMYEHYWVGDNEESLCETCGEIVTKNTPCKESKGYPIWLDYNDLEFKAQQFIDSLEGKE